MRQASLFYFCGEPGRRGRGVPDRPSLSLLQLSKQTRAGWECLLGCGSRSSYLVLKPPAAFRPPSLRGDFPVPDARRGRAAVIRPAGKVGAPLRSSLAAPGNGEPRSFYLYCTFLLELGGDNRGAGGVSCGSRGARRSHRGSRPGRGGQRAGWRAPPTPGGAAPSPAPPPGLGGRNRARATFLRFPPAQGLGTRCGRRRRRGSSRLERAAQAGGEQRARPWIPARLCGRRAWALAGNSLAGFTEGGW